MVEIKTIELDERTREWIKWFDKLREDAEKYIQSRLGISKEQLGEPKR